MEADIVARAGIPFRGVTAAGLRGSSLGQMVANGLALLNGCVQAWRIERAFKPNVVLATGGYASVPAVVAAWLRRCPVLVYLPDILPGLAVRFLSRLARRVAVSFDASLVHFAVGKVKVTGYPVRQALYAGSARSGKKRLGLDPDLSTVLILGGSRGAHSINEAVSEALESLLEKAQLVHIAGVTDVAWLKEQRQALPIGPRERYHVYEYLHEKMADALLAADLAVARAGAATMGEFAAVGVPSVLVPYPHAGHHQEANADFMVSRGAALKVLDGEMRNGALAQVVGELLSDSKRRARMAQSASRLARPDAASAIALELALLAGGT
jgi:UDP-N-acetylglucosamine--N-acetylmuramyl-(pentapeptide) pyrophosphoryl-undecaprenol N-acetylglucosamine transferase